MTVIAKAGRYELLEELGRGAMGIVYRAQDPVIGRTVAVKTLHVTEHASGLSPEELLRRFHTEARAAGLLSHPNIVAVYDAGKEDEFFYIIMELVQGKSLQSLIGERHAFPLARVLRLMQQACAALEFAHRNNVVHRDIKPANLILTPDDTLKISDFGTAKILQFQTAQTGQIVGTPSYMSPEQIKGRPVDGRSDIFSLGGVLYEMLTGVKPFPGDTITAVIYKIVSEEPAPPREIDASIHPGLSAIVLRALSKSPEARFQSCVQFFDALQNYREYEPANFPAAAPKSPEGANIESAGDFAAISSPVFSADATPPKQGGSVWLALFLLAVIGVSGYKVWPPLRDLWLRTQPPPVATAPAEKPSDTVAADSTPSAAPAAASDAIPSAAPGASASIVAPATSASPTSAAAANSLPPAAVTPTAVASVRQAVPAPPTATPLSSTATVPAITGASESKSSGATPALATVAVRPQASAPAQPAARPSISSAAADWRDHVVSMLTEAGLADRVRAVAAGSTLTLNGKLDTRAHRTLLGLLQDGPADVQIVDHIEDVAAPAPRPSPNAPEARPAPQN